MEALILKILKFRNERNWDKYHNIKDLIIGLNIEVAELQELFLWKKEGESIDNEEISKELSDIFIFLVYISDHCDIDLLRGISEKIEIHKKHYPINLSKDNTEKYTNLKTNQNNDENSH